jgi:Putative DNA-binding domain
MRRSSMLPLETLQRVMTASILSQTSSRLGSKLEAGDANPVNRFAIYRNNTLISLTESLKANFPVTVRLVHERFFHWVVQEFIRHHPPEEARLSSYGAKLPAYLAGLPACRSVPYVAEVARLEWAICISLHAEHRDSCSIEMLSRLGGAVGDARLILQPALQLIPARWPIIDIWKAHQRSAVELPGGITRQPTYVQVTRTADRIRLSPLSAGRCTFRRGLARGLSLNAAIRLATSRDRSFAPGVELASLFGENIVTDVVAPQGGTS